MLNELIDNTFVWIPEKGIGYYPVTDFVYDEAYFNKYKEYAESRLGRRLTEERIKLVEKYYSGKVVDVGIGSGHFVSARKDTLGFDVNPFAVRWLKQCNKYISPDNVYIDIEALTFWDSLEHIKDIKTAVSYSKDWIFLSLPIFSDLSNILSSKHFRKNEHFWYFTEKGLITWFSDQGFGLVEMNFTESMLGRDDIASFVFRRV